MQFPELIIYFLFAPLLLIPIEKMLPFPYLIEEFFKLFILYFFLKEKKQKLSSLQIFVLAFVFSFSESIFYLKNIFILGRFELFFFRLIFTLLLNILTLFLIFLGLKKTKITALICLTISIVIHFIFNKYIENLKFIF